MLSAVNNGAAPTHRRLHFDEETGARVPEHGREQRPARGPPSGQVRWRVSLPPLVALVVVVSRHSP